MKPTIFVVLAILFSIPSPAAADTPILFGFTAVKDCVAVLIAKEEGFFEKRGLDVELRLMQNSSTEATAIIAGAMTLGCNTPPVLIQAINRGVALSGIAGGSVSSLTDKTTAVVVRPDAGISTPADFVGKKVGVSGIGSTGYVMFNQWLISEHVDFKRVSFFEVPFSTQYDVLKRGTVDAVVSVTPILNRILADKTGTALEYLEAPMPPGTPLVIYISTADWAIKNPALVNAVRGALSDATKFALTHQSQADQLVAKYLNQPLSSVQATSYSLLDSRLTAKQTRWWIDSMKDQGLIQSGNLPTNVVAR